MWVSQNLESEILKQIVERKIIKFHLLYNAILIICNSNIITSKTIRDDFNKKHKVLKYAMTIEK
jgi:hypothetical protein